MRRNRVIGYSGNALDEERVGGAGAVGIPDGDDVAGADGTARHTHHEQTFAVNQGGLHAPAPHCDEEQITPGQRK
nr:hypothetical protein [Actinomadura rudentiformis]